MDDTSVVARIESAMADIDAVAWDALANPDPACANPFLSHTFLKTLEDAGCVSARNGWLPQHIVIEDGAGGLAGVMPCYLKSHSRGEFVFDYGWADAYERAGGRYYPKLQSAVPFSPVTGARFLVGHGPEAPRRRQALLAAAVELTSRHRASSFHATFVTEEEWSSLGEMGLLQRTDQQFHWANDGYASFEDFLSALASRKRKSVRKERREAIGENGVSIDWVTGSDLTEAHWDAFYAFYEDTGARKWGAPYLNRRFFSLLGERMADQVLLVMASRAGRPIAGALNMIGGDTLYGRYWGCSEHHPCLHFEACYYQAIDFAIEKGLSRVEAGAQGEHKLARGYVPQTTYSLHWLPDPGFREAVADFLERERDYVAMAGEALAAHAPFRKSGD